MSYTKNLLKINFHYDDDTGMYTVGEVDFEISGILDEFLKEYGAKGKNKIVNTLGYLIYETERRFRELPDQGACKDATEYKLPNP